MSDEELAQVMNGSVWGICKKCREMNGDAFVECSDCKTVWLKAEHKEPIKLSDTERVILENLPEEYKWIGRDEDNVLKIGTKKLKKSDRGFWYCKRCHEFTILEPFEHLFQFIQWSDNEPYEISELLKGE